MSEREPVATEREQHLTRLYLETVRRVSRLLFREDPIGIAVGNPHEDEYDSVAAKVLVALPHAPTREAFEREFRKLLDESFGVSKWPRRYSSLAETIWQETSDYRQERGSK